MYRSITALRKYVLIAQDRPRIEQFARQAHDAWLLSDAAGLYGAIALDTTGEPLALRAANQQVDFDTGALPVTHADGSS